MTLAGLAYRGFQDILPGEPHEFVVRQAVLDGLRTLAPVKDEWELVWGPATGRGTPDELPLVLHGSERSQPVQDGLPHDELVRLAGQDVLKPAIGETREGHRDLVVAERHRSTVLT